MAEMSEIEALASVCAEIDGAIRADPARGAGVASVLGLDALPGYRRPIPRRGDRPSEAPAGLPPVDDALAYLAQDATLHADIAPSVVLALAGLIKADPQRGPNGASHVMVARVLARRELKPAALEVDLASEVERLPTRADVARVMDEAGLNVDPVATFKTPVMCHHYEMDDVKKVLTPGNWTCSDHWKGMTPAEDPQGPHGELHYREEVALGGGLEALTVQACLRFVQSELVRTEGQGPLLVLDYKRCGVDEHQEGTGVLVDEGWLVAEEKDDGVLITTSKRVQFADETIDGLSGVMTACGLGYSRLARDFVAKCLECKEAKDGWAPVEVADGR